VRCSVGVALFALLTFSAIASAQYQSPSEYLFITAGSASTRQQGEGSIVEAQGNVTIQLDRAKLSGDSAVIWLPGAAGPHQQQQAQIALIGHASVVQKGSTRTGDRLFVTADITGTIRLTAQHQEPPTQPSELFTQAQALRDLIQTAAAAKPPAGGAQSQAAARGTQPTADSGSAPATTLPERAQNPQIQPVHPPAVARFVPTTHPGVTTNPDDESQATTRRAGTTHPSTRPANPPVTFEAEHVETAETPDHHAAIVLSGGVFIYQDRPKGQTIELRAERAVLFTTVESLKELSNPKRGKRVQDSVESAYLEGDVRINYTSPIKGEQRLIGDRVYYEFASDRAILTDAILHTVDAKRQIPIVLRARILRQLAQGEYNAEKAKLSSSSFALPSVAIAADRIYVKSDTATDTGDQETYFKANNVTVPVFGIPAFYWPSLSGTADNSQSAFRGAAIENRTGFGFGPETEWGLFETLGLKPSKDLDAAYRLDYFSERGVGFGLSAAYQGGNITDTTRQPWEFEGDFKAYFVNDMGQDNLNRALINEYRDETLRGRILWEHTHYFPDGWEAQLRAGWVSDSTFLENWYRQDYETELPLSVSAYIKHQHDTESTTFLFDIQPSHVVTSSDLEQEQFEVERYPEIGYRRIGDSFLGDQLTFFSDNTADAIKMQPSRDPLSEQGYDVKAGISPGIPSLGTTGIFPHTVYRENFRQEVDYPFTLGPIRVVPYTMGILTQYSDSPNGGEITRLFAGAGARFSTAFWKVDPYAQSELFDIHQLRHIIQPEVNLFTSAQNISHQDVYIYDEPIDAVNDISAAQFALRQTWQTKRGAPGEWRNVDVFSLNIEANYFANKPPPHFQNPFNFRGLFFSSLPEASVPRDSFNADASWRISDETVMLADCSENLDKGDLATAAIGILVRRGDRLSYFVENRYVEDLNANITSASITYQLTNKYLVAISQSFNFSNGQDVSSGISVQRAFDAFAITVTAYRDLTTNTNSFSVNLTPTGFSHGAGTGAFSNSFHQ
jgi:lipopolysaccharide export system protein LptA